VKTTLKDYRDIDLRDGYKSEAFKNGKIFAGLVKEYDESAIDYSALGNEKHVYVENCKLAFSAAENTLEIPQILEAEELAGGKCNEKQLQLYLSLLYNAYNEKDRGMTKEALMKKVNELEEIVQVLSLENATLKESLAQTEASFSQLNEQLSLSSEEHNKVRRQQNEANMMLSELEENYSAERMFWDEQLAALRAQKNKLAENSDEQTNLLSHQLDETSANRDSLREELRKAKEEALKEKEELEAAHKKLLGKLDRYKKSKEELQDIKKDMEASHEHVMPVLSHSVIQHANDMNPWSGILEQERKYVPKHVKVPDENAVKSLEYMEQLKSLSTLLNFQNRSFDLLLYSRSKEKQEVLSVELGKLKKREMTKAELEERELGAESSEEEVPTEPKKTTIEQSPKKPSAQKMAGGWQNARKAKK